MTYLRKIDPFVFEELILNVFESKKVKIIRNKKYTGDGGIDGKIKNADGELILIQAKRYSNYVNPKHIEDLSNKVIEMGAVKGLFIHTGKTGKKTYEKTYSSNIEIYSGGKLIDFLIK